MTLAEHLAESGVSLRQEVGFIVEGFDDTGTWRATHARTARVCTEIPEDAYQHEEVLDYDPEYDLALVWQTAGKPFLCHLSMTDKSTLYWVEVGGLIIEGPDHRVFIGQDETFMASVAEM